MIARKASLASNLKKYYIGFTPVLRNIQLCSVILKQNKIPEESFDILEELKPHYGLDEEEIEKKRNKSRLPERVYKIFVKKEALPPEYEYDFQMYRLRGHYGKFGESSNLNPGILWPTREEILETIEYDKIFEPPLKETLKKLEAKRLEEKMRKEEVEADVDSKMKNLDKWIAEYYARIEKRKQEAIQLKRKRELLVEEISEYLGYDIDPRDPRFQEAVEQREKEKKKAHKARKQQESYDKMLAKLKQVAEESKPS